MSAPTPKLTVAEARALLGIAAEAGLEEAGKAFRAAAKRAHPDRPGEAARQRTQHSQGVEATARVARVRLTGASINPSSSPIGAKHRAVLPRSSTSRYIGERSSLELRA